MILVLYGYLSSISKPFAPKGGNNPLLSQISEAILQHTPFIHLNFIKIIDVTTVLS